MYALHKRHIEEFKALQSRMRYMPAEDLYDIYCMYAKMESDAMKDIAGEEAAAEYMFIPVFGTMFIGNDRLIECETVASKLRKRMAPLSFVAIMDYFVAESNQAVLKGDEATLANASEQMKKYSNPRTHLKAEYLEKDIQAAAAAEDYERAMELQKELVRMKTRT